MWENEFSAATVLTESECFQHLSQVSLGRIAISIDALPVILPVHFVVSNESVIFPTVAGSKFDTATAGTVVAFQADEQDPFSGDYWSVLLQGMASAAGDSPGDAEDGASRWDLAQTCNGSCIWYGSKRPWSAGVDSELPVRARPSNYLTPLACSHAGSCEATGKSVGIWACVMAVTSTV